jgi:S-DNA-T family DNA segregation ATPase FtsK/SpoIIIE
MLVYIFSDELYIKVSLPEIIDGIFPVYSDGKLIANITQKDNSYEIQLSDKFISSDGSILKCKLEPYAVQVLSPTNTPYAYNIVLVPKYDSNTFLFDAFKEITIGNTADCDISYVYNKKVNTGEVLKLTQQTPAVWVVETEFSNFYISNKKARTGMKVLTGDYIFFYGLKIIILGNKLLINNPNGGVKIASNGKLRAAEIDKKELNAYKATNQMQKSEDPLFSEEDYFFKAPRLNYIIKNEKVSVDSPPAKNADGNTSMVMILGPQLTMAVSSVITLINFVQQYNSGALNKQRFITSMITIGATLAGTFLWPTIARTVEKHRNKKAEKNRVKKYTEYLEKKSSEIEQIKANQLEIINANHPSFTECINIISGKKKELWQRSVDQEDFLSVRLGIGKVDTKIDIDVPKDGFILEEDPLTSKMKAICSNALHMENVPITYTFTNQIVNAVIGKPKITKEFLDCVLLQMMTLHSYTDLKVVVYTNNPEEWDYLKIAPHCWDNKKSIRYFASSVEDLMVISSDLEKIFDARVENDEEETLEDDGTNKNNNYKDFRPYYLFFIDDISALRNISLINKILHYKRNVGFSILCTAENISSLPAEATDFISIDEKQAVITKNGESVDNQIYFRPDLNPNGFVDLHVPMQMMANIPIKVEKEKYELPKSLSFLEMYNLGRVEQFNSLNRWKENNPVQSLSVPIGIDQNGELFKMDIHEKYYGPHGLVAGTTGSGKSEWIITYILSLAVNFSPEEVQFVLIDFKGGGLAMSFENAELGVKLPHLAGKITNLDRSEIYRSIAAIESELKRRQSIFNAAREKLKEGSMNIYKYQQFYRRGMVDEPLSHLLIICDEFAEMKQQQPDFMEQLISTSRIGRSLGIHLILATQKPSGVVNDQIWSNSRFKVCLKVQDKSDSNEVLKKPDAAFLKQTGAFYLQVGNDDYYNLGQSAWAGAKYYPSDAIKHHIDTSTDYIDNLGRIINSYDKEEPEEIQVENQGEELLNIVSYISNITKNMTIKSRSLWLENINPVIYLSEILKKYNRKPQNKYTYNIAIGEYDEPREQKQGLLEINLSDGNIAIMGQNDPGIETLLSTIIWSSICEHTPWEIAYYIIDFGSETLKKFAKFPHVGEVVFQDDMDKVTGVLDLVIEEFERRKELLSDYNGSFSYYNKVSDKKLPLIVTVINSFDIFSEQIPKLNDYMTTLFRDTPKYGIIFIVTGNSPQAIRQRQLQYFNHTILMQLSDDSQYRGITGCRRNLIPMKAKGRGICKIDSTNADSYCEFQTAFIAPEEKELDYIRMFANRCIDYYKYKVKELAKVPEDVTSEQLSSSLTTLEDVPIGYNFYEKDIAKFNFVSRKINMISGKNIMDNIGFIYALASLLSKVPNTKVRIIDMLSIFKKPMLDLKLFNENLDVVFGALLKDVEERQSSQDQAINIIIGAGQIKQKLSEAGNYIANKMFNKINESQKITFILVDDYEKLRTVRLEKWFNEIADPTSGIWLGEGASNQSLFKINEISSEDKKYDFAGLAFSIEGGEYKVIKTVMDGDE